MSLHYWCTTEIRPGPKNIGPIVNFVFAPWKNGVFAENKNQLMKLAPMQQFPARIGTSQRLGWRYKTRRRSAHSISNRCRIVTKSLSRAVFEITGLKDIGITTLTFYCHATSSMTSSFDTAHAISYRCPIVTKSLSRAVFEITGLTDIGITTLTFHGHVTSLMTSSFDPPPISG